MADKIINTFQQRRQLENDIAALTETENEAALLQAVRHIAQNYPTDMVRNGLLKNLDTNSNQMRGGLGHLATLLPPEEITSALRSTVADRARPPQVRLNAAMILERFLGQEVAPALLSDLQDSNDIAFQSLRDAVTEAEQNRYILLEYVTQMREESAEVAHLVVEHAARLSAANRLELLRLIAQDDRPPVANAALQQLEQMTAADTVAEVGDELARTLHTLHYTLPPEQAQRIQRALRKLQFGGAGYTPPATAGWRALLSPAEASGNQAVWFLSTPPEDAPSGPFLSLVVNLYTGVLAAYGHDEMEAVDLPTSHEIGELVAVAAADNEDTVLLEAPFDFGRWLVQQALTAHWEGRAWQSLFGEYSLYNDWIWQFDAPQVDETLLALCTIEATQDDDAATLDPVQIETAATELLRHPAMLGWHTYGRLIVQTLREHVALDAHRPATENAITLLRSLTGWLEHKAIFHGFQAGLRTQAGWLQIAGSQRSAQHAQFLATHFAHIPPEQNPFLVQLFAQALQE